MSNGNVGTSGQERQSQVNHQCNRLAEAICRLEGISGNLSKRLEPVLSPTAPQPKEAQGDKESLCSLANCLRSLADRTEAQVDFVKNLFDRLEV